MTLHFFRNFTVFYPHQKCLKWGLCNKGQLGKKPSDKKRKKSLIEIENDTFNDLTMGTFLQIKRSKHKYHLQMKSKHEEPTNYFREKWKEYTTGAYIKRLLWANLAAVQRFHDEIVFPKYGRLICIGMVMRLEKYRLRLCIDLTSDHTNY